MTDHQSGKLSHLSSQMRYLISLCKNTLSILGILITTVSGVLILILFLLEALNFISNPYVGILTYLVMPFFFITGLILIPVGIVRVKRLRRRMTDAGQIVPELIYPCWDFNDLHVRRTAFFVILATVLNVVILSIATYMGVHTMETAEFCGAVCHTVMQPEYTSYQGSPHAKVACTSCHIGPGAPWFVKSKLSGVRQVFAVTFNSYSRPIPTPVHDLRPARETCEQCHWPQKFHDTKVRVSTHYRDDEKNTQLTTALLLKVGGVKGKAGAGSGIHWWHMDPINKVRYVSDEKRQTIYWVEHSNTSGETKEYILQDSPQPQLDLNRAEKRVMDCVDCHNRPTHIYRLPEDAVDIAISLNQIDGSLPFVKKKGVELLKASYSNGADAQQKISASLRGYYQSEYPQVLASQSAAINSSGQALAAIYNRNVFPAMKVTWGTYPNNLGHQDFPGCFRCHDESHKSKDGKTITQDCSACHDLLMQEEEKPVMIPELLQSKK